MVYPVAMRKYYIIYTFYPEIMRQAQNLMYANNKIVTVPILYIEDLQKDLQEEKFN